MLNSNEIKDYKFTRAARGYKLEEVDELLDRIEEDYDQYERVTLALKTKVEELTAENDELKKSQNSIQSVLLSAQKLADEIVGKAKEKAEEVLAAAKAEADSINAEGKRAFENFETDFAARKAEAEKQLLKDIEKLKNKASVISAGTEDSIKRQQMLFDKLKLEIVAFKSEISKQYKAHLDIIKNIPDVVPTNPEEIAKILTFDFEKQPDAQEFLTSDTANTVKKETEAYDEPTIEEDVAEDINEAVTEEIINEDLDDNFEINDTGFDIKTEPVTEDEDL